MPILTSHKNGIHYIEFCKIVANDTKLSFIKSEDSIEKYFSLPHSNLSILLLGPGTSVTQKAAQMLSSEGVMFGFTSGGGTPLFLASNSEYRPTEHLQNWISWWSDEQKRLIVAKDFQLKRIEFVTEIWSKYFKEFFDSDIVSICNKYRNGLEISQNTNSLLGYEANFTKSIYKLLAQKNNISGFKRTAGQSIDKANDFIDQGNYLAYGIASVSLWGLGIPPSLAVIHGKTRRGALVFDVADIFKDAIILPMSFKMAGNKSNSRDFRAEVINIFDKTKIMTKIFNIVKDSSRNFQK